MDDLELDAFRVIKLMNIRERMTETEYEEFSKNLSPEAVDEKFKELYLNNTWSSWNKSGSMQYYLCWLYIYAKIIAFSDFFLQNLLTQKHQNCFLSDDSGAFVIDIHKENCIIPFCIIV